MKPAIAGVVVFRAAVWTHRERRHRRPLSVVRSSSNNRQPRTALGAIKKRIMIPSVIGIEEFSQAVITCGDVGGNEDRMAGITLAVFNPEMWISPWCSRRRQHLVNSRQGGRRCGQLAEKPIEGFQFPLNFDQDATGLVSDKTVQTKPMRKIKDERAESNTLNDSAHGECATVHGVGLSVEGTRSRTRAKTT
jgi:hypothetical protein